MNTSVYRMAVIIAMGAITGFAVNSGNVLLLIVTVAAGLLLLNLREKDVKEDERTYFVSEKAARTTLQIYGIAVAVLGAILITLKNEIGYALEYSVCFLLVIYLVAYGFYNKKYG